MHKVFCSGALLNKTGSEKLPAISTVSDGIAEGTAEKHRTGAMARREVQSGDESSKALRMRMAIGRCVVYRWRKATHGRTLERKLKAT
jgi:hypothetical protein